MYFLYHWESKIHKTFFSFCHELQQGPFQGSHKPAKLLFEQTPKLGASVSLLPILWRNSGTRNMAHGTCSSEHGTSLASLLHSGATWLLIKTVELSGACSINAEQVRSLSSQTWNLWWQRYKVSFQDLKPRTCVPECANPLKEFKMKLRTVFHTHDATSNLGTRNGTLHHSMEG